MEFMIAAMIVIILQYKIGQLHAVLYLMKILNQVSNKNNHILIFVI